MTAEVLDKFSTLITTALGLVAALAWNTAIQNLFNAIFGQTGGELVGQFFYAILVTLAVIFATMYVGRAAERAKKAEEERGGLFGRSKSWVSGFRQQASGRFEKVSRVMARWDVSSGTAQIHNGHNARPSTPET